MNREEALARARGRPASSPANRSLERGIEILRAFRPGAEVMGNGELAERTGLSRSTVSRLTQTLVQSGFLQYDAPLRAYRLAAPVLSLAHAMRAGSVVLQTAAPLMRELAQSQRINVGLAVADSVEMVYLESVRYNRKPSLRTVVAGQRVPMALTSLGRAWLAAVPPAQRKAVLSRILAGGKARSAGVAEAIRAAIDSVQREGWCMASWQPEVVAVSTPLAIPCQPIHVLNVSVTTTAAPDDMARELAPLLMALAARIVSNEALHRGPV